MNASFGTQSACPSLPVRVLHINTERTWRGGEQQTLYLARGQRDSGLAVTVACQPDSPMARRAAESGLDVAQIRMRGEGDVWAWYKLARLIRQRKFDIVHMHTSHAHTVGCLASGFARRGVRIVTRRVNSSLIKSPVSRIKYKYGVTKYIAVSNAIKQVMTDDGIAADRIAVVHDGVDIARFDRERPDERVQSEFRFEPNTPVIGNVAFMDRKKGHKHLVDAVPEVLKAFPTAMFMIVGDGELRPELERRAVQLGISNSVVFTGFREDIPELLGMFDVFAMPSLMEGLCTSVLDAMAAGVPVVASDVGGIPEIVLNEVNGLLVPASESAPLAKAILRLLKNRDEAARFARVGKRTVEEKFTVDTMVEGNIRVYDRLLAGESRATS